MKKKNNEAATVKESLFFRLHNYTLGPLALLIFAPLLTVIISESVLRHGGSFAQYFAELSKMGFVNAIRHLLIVRHTTTSFAVSVVAGYGLVQLLLMLVVPGKVFKGPVTPNGFTPVYKDNGFRIYLINLVLFGVVTKLCYDNGHTPTIILDRYTELGGALHLLATFLCVILLLKGILWPTTPPGDSGWRGNILFDYYWGTDLYPKILGVDVKVFTNCRFGMIGWVWVVLLGCLRNFESFGYTNSAAVCALIQMIYLTKFFLWEAGYMATIDIMLDRAGFYLCWGCIVFIAGLYQAPSLYMAFNNVPMSNTTALSLFLIGGVFSVTLNYYADWQKMYVRSHDGNCKLWGRPAEVIRAKYRLNTGQERTSILLVSGFWGLARHFHYLPELIAAFCWCAPAGFTHVLPYSYFLMVTGILLNRTYRDDRKCSEKYGHYWEDYTRRVPYRILPYIY